jgi:hypothetical protein
MGTAATHTHGAAAKVCSATPTAEVRATTTATAEVSTAATSAAKMSTTTTAPAETAASCVSSRRQTKGNCYCGRACRDFPHDTPRQGQMRQANARSPGPFHRVAAMHTSRVLEHVRNPSAAPELDGLNFFHTEPPVATGRIIG